MSLMWWMHSVSRLISVIHTCPLWINSMYFQNIYWLSGKSVNQNSRCTFIDGFSFDAYLIKRAKSRKSFYLATEQTCLQHKTLFWYQQSEAMRRRNIYTMLQSDIISTRNIVYSQLGPASIAQLVECPLRGTRGHGFDPGPRHTKVIKKW